MARIKVHTSTVEISQPFSDVASLAVAQYSGVITAKTFIDLRTQAIQRTPDVGSFVVNVAPAVLLMGLDPFIPTNDDYRNIADGVVICRPDQLEVMQFYARHMAEHGVIRAVYLASEQDRALVMARRLAAQRRRSPASPQLVPASTS